LCKNYLECLDMVVDTVIWGSEICIYFVNLVIFLCKLVSFGMKIIICELPGRVR
jgi:hypothetical protein